MPPLPLWSLERPAPVPGPEPLPLKSQHIRQVAAGVTRLLTQPGRAGETPETLRLPDAPPPLRGLVREGNETEALDEVTPPPPAAVPAERGTAPAVVTPRLRPPQGPPKPRRATGAVPILRETASGISSAPTPAGLAREERQTVAPFPALITAVRQAVLRT